MLRVEPLARHTHTIFALHGLGSNASAMRDKFGPILEASSGARVVYLQAPVAYVTCYRRRMRSWHDYFTDRAGLDVEDEVDGGDLARVADRIHRLVDAEPVPPAAIALFGESQGAGVALYAGLAYHARLGAVLSSFGYLHSRTPLVSAPPVRAFYGERDAIIAPALVRASFRAAGVAVVARHADVEHCVESDEERAWLATALAELLPRRAAPDQFWAHRG